MPYQMTECKRKRAHIEASIKIPSMHSALVAWVRARLGAGRGQESEVDIWVAVSICTQRTVNAAINAVAANTIDIADAA